MSKTDKAVPATKPTATPAPSTKDTGAVSIGGASMRFASTADKGKVHIGGASMRF